MGEHEHSVSRRELIKRGGAAAAVLGLGSLAGTEGAAGALLQAAATPKRGGTLRLGSSIQNNDYNPVTYTAQEDYFVVYQMYRGLTIYNTAKRDYVLDMAESVDVAKGGRVWTYKLKKGITYHDGGELTARDVKFSVDMKLSPKSKSPQRSYYPTGMRVRVIDKYTVQFVLDKPTALLPAALGPASGAIFPARAAKTLGKKPMGTGPFKFVSQVKGKETTLSRFDDYYGGRPYLDRVIYQPLPESASRVAALLSGQVQFINFVPFERINDLKKNNSIQVFAFPSTWIDFLMFNTRRAPFNNRQARQAVAYAIDRRAVSRIASVGTGGPEDTLVSDWAPARPTVKPLPYDPDRARSLVKSTGLDKLDLTIVATPVEYPAMGRAAEYIATALNAVGMKVKVDGVDIGTWVQRSISTPDFDMSYQGFIAGIDADARTYGQFHSKGSLNWGAYNGGPRFDALLEAQRQEPNTKKRARILSQAWQQITNDVPWYMPYWLPGAQAAAKNVRGFKYQPEMYPFLERVWLA
jgi:peptide/nickel transport system substrate-binding protein